MIEPLVAAVIRRKIIGACLGKNFDVILPLCSYQLPQIVCILDFTPFSEPKASCRVKPVHLHHSLLEGIDEFRKTTIESIHDEQTGMITNNFL